MTRRWRRYGHVPSVLEERKAISNRLDDAIVPWGTCGFGVVW